MKRNKKDGGEGSTKSSLLIPAVIVSLGLVAAGFLFGGGGNAPAAAAPPEPSAADVEEGPVAPIDPITLNLAGGHYLKLGLALQFAAEDGDHAEELPPGATAKASDVAIDLFGRYSMDELSDPAARAAVKEELVSQIRAAYHDAVIDVYFTEFVMQ